MPGSHRTDKPQPEHLRTNQILRFLKGTVVTHGNGVRAGTPAEWQAPGSLLMPILPRESDIFPSELLDDQGPLEAAEGQWWALYTMARREKELMRRLRGLEVAFYSPLVHKRSRSPGGRVRESYVPLFASYVFAFGTEQARQKALTTNCVARCLEVPDPGQLVHDLRQIRHLIELDAPLTVEARIEPGRRVRVRSGPMMGLEGTVAKRRGKDWLVVAVEFLGQGASVMLEDFRVEPL